MFEDLFPETLTGPEVGPGDVLKGDTPPLINQVAATGNLTYEDFNFEDLCLYAGVDCVATSGVLVELWPELNKKEVLIAPVEKGKDAERKIPSIMRSVQQIEMPSHEFILDLEINGIGYSVGRNRFYHEKMVNHISELDEKIFTAIGKRIDLNSGPAIAKFLYDERGFTPPYLTKAGEPATDGEAFMTLAGLDPTRAVYVAPDSSLQFLADMAVRRDVASVHNTFIKTYHTDWVKERTGRIHPSYNLFGTSSFRITGSDPNLTQLPRPKHGYNVRDCYSEEEGMVFFSFDFSSAEVKILANVAKEPAMLQAIADGLDFHTYSASAMRNIPYAEVAAVLSDSKHELYKTYKELRQLSKILTFSILYGSSTAGIANQLNLTTDKAQELIDLYFNTFPRIKKFIEDCHNMAKLNKFIITPLGQRKRQYGTYQCFRPTASYNASLRNSQNVMIQSTTSSVGLITFAEVNQRIKHLGAKSTCTVYDSLEIACPVDKAAECAAICFETLDKWPVETFDFLELPIGCEGEVGISWGELEVVHPGVTQEQILATLAEIKQKSERKFGSLML